ncbi:YopX family protein [Ignavigranum ruoffiae]|uniref:YopX family protein n=1 Tax=Ignavigranum ruoffiae TaxID=89093 RepID=UPI00235242C6|nr:YopX family protein [Ignavigranum ruoffiae]
MIPKFRAWDKEHNEWFDDYGVFRLALLKNGEIIMLYAGNYRGYADEVEVDLSTGLFDKNGKEIFEGDILSTDLERPYLVVERHNTYFLYQCNDGKEDYYDTMLSVREKHIEQDMTVEIIGNIYENPELLEVDE